MHVEHFTYSPFDKSMIDKSEDLKGKKCYSAGNKVDTYKSRARLTD